MTTTPPGIDPATGLPPQQQGYFTPPPPPAPPQPIVIQQPPVQQQKDPLDELKMWFNDEREKIRKEEKDKLYPQLAEMEGQLKTLTQEREAALEAQQQKEQERLAEEERLRQEALGVAGQFEEYRSEMDKRFATLEQERERDRLLLEKEREFAELVTYRSDQLALAGDDIAPQFHDFIRGSNREQIDQSIAAAKSKTAEIMAGMQQVQRTNLRTSAPLISGQPPVDPNAMSGDDRRELSIEELRAMPIEEYEALRPQLLRATSDRVKQNGLYAP